MTAASVPVKSRDEARRVRVPAQRQHRHPQAGRPALGAPQQRAGVAVGEGRARVSREQRERLGLGEREVARAQLVEAARDAQAHEPQRRVAAGEDHQPQRVDGCSSSTSRSAITSGSVDDVEVVEHRAPTGLGWAAIRFMKATSAAVRRAGQPERPLAGQRRLHRLEHERPEQPRASAAHRRATTHATGPGARPARAHVLASEVFPAPAGAAISVSGRSTASVSRRRSAGRWIRSGAGAGAPAASLSGSRDTDRLTLAVHERTALGPFSRSLLSVQPPHERFPVHRGTPSVPRVARSGQRQLQLEAVLAQRAPAQDLRSLEPVEHGVLVQAEALGRRAGVASLGQPGATVSRSRPGASPSTPSPPIARRTNGTSRSQVAAEQRDDLDLGDS